MDNGPGAPGAAGPPRPAATPPPRPPPRCRARGRTGPRAPRPAGDPAPSARSSRTSRCRGGALRPPRCLRGAPTGPPQGHRGTRARGTGDLRRATDLRHPGPDGFGDPAPRRGHGPGVEPPPLVDDLYHDLAVPVADPELG